jgi:uncharacterized RDD family membrane protein YckC
MDLLDTPFSDTPKHMHQAPNGIRLANYVIDQLAAAVLSYLVMLFFAATGRADGFFTEGGVFLPLTFLGVSAAYYTISEFSSGKTLGKLLTGSVVQSEDGTPPRLAQCTLRAIIRMIPFYPLFFLFGVRLHDRLSNTQVVAP